MKLDAKTILFSIICLVLAFGLVKAKMDNNSLKEQHEQELKELVKAYADTLLVVRTERGEVTEKYLTAVGDLDQALGDNERLRQKVRETEKRLSIKVHQVEELTLRLDTLEISHQGEIHAPDPNALVTDSYVTISEDTSGVKIQGRVYWPSGKYSLKVERQPLDFIVTLQQSETGALVKKTIEFPDQPWVHVSSWDVVTLAPEGAKKKGWLSGLIPNFGSFGVFGGVSAGKTIGGDVGVSLGNTHMFINFESNGTTVHLAKTFKLW